VDSPIASYEYDYLGRRTEKTIYDTPNVTTKYAYDGDQVIAECNESGDVLRKFIYGPGIDEPICMIDVSGEAETRYYYHFDGLASVAALSDVNGKIVKRYSYDVFDKREVIKLRIGTHTGRPLPVERPRKNNKKTQKTSKTR
jgi:uncharacterized protein RhaS with RHS repeats